MRDPHNRSSGGVHTPTRGGSLILTILSSLLVCLWTFELLYLAWRRIFWCDELLLVSLIRALPVGEIVPALRAGADGGLPLAYFIFKLWRFPLDLPELTMRLPSVLSGLCTAVALYLGCRTYLGRQAALFCAVLGTFGSTMVLRHASEVRFYGLLYCGAVVVWAALVRLRQLEFDRASFRIWGWLAFVAAANLVLIFSHQFGIIYSLIFCVFAGITFRPYCLRRLLLAVSPFAFGWVMFVLYLPVVMDQRGALTGNQPLYDAPSLASLAKVFLQLMPGFSYEGRADEPSYPAIAVVMTLLLWLTALALALAAGGWARAKDSNLPRSGGGWPDLMLAGALLGVPVLIWLVAQVGDSLLLYRYLLPSQLGFIILFSLLLRSLYEENRVRLLFGAVMFIIVAWSAVGLSGVSPKAEQLHRAFVSAGSSKPLLSTSLAEFYFLRHYQPRREVYYLLDAGWAEAIKPQFSQALAEQNIQAARKTFGMADGVVSVQDLASLGDSFVVSAFNEITLNYLNDRVPGFELVERTVGAETIPVLIRR